jgi:hypothetical protein
LHQSTFFTLFLINNENPPKTATMGADWYQFKSYASSGNAILISLNDVKKVFQQEVAEGEKNKNEDTGNAKRDGEEENFKFGLAKLDSKETDWLLAQTEGFRVYLLGASFMLAMRPSNRIIEGPELNTAGPYEIESNKVSFDVSEAQPGDEYNDLMALACRLTPPGQKPTCFPGQYLFSMTNSYILEVLELDNKKEQQHGSICFSKSGDGVTPLATDFDVVVGTGEKKRVFKTYKSLLQCYMPSFDALVEDLTTATKLELPDLDPESFEIVLEASTTRSTPHIPYSLRHEIEKVKNTLGLLPNETSGKKQKTEHPALNNACLLDTTFLVGPNKEEVRANRQVLALTNPVLCRILYGTGSLTVDSTQPIDWLQFEPQVVRQVFSSLVSLGKKPALVPLQHVAPTKELLDYLMESSEGLGLTYESPFKSPFKTGKFTLIEMYDDENEIEYFELDGFF